TDALAAEGEPDLRVRPPNEIDGRARPRLVHRDDRRAEPSDEASLAQRLRERVAERGEHVLRRVVLVDVEIAGGDALQVERAVPGEQLEQVVEEADARRHARASPPVEG